MRLRTIDGLRGIAALAVVLFHLNGAAEKSYGAWAPAWVRWLFGQGFLGVEVFFVLSGFVIAYSVRNAVPTFAFLGRFALRRLVRLDPPYWVAIALESGLIWATYHEWPAVSRVAAHLVYAQNIVGAGDILPIFWTLCYEVQFYLFLVAALVVGQHLPRRRQIATAAFVVLFLASLYVRYGIGPVGVPGLALIRWFQFFLGVLVWWVVSGTASRWWLVAAWVATAAAGLTHRPQELLPIAISALLWWSYRRDGMASILSARPWQFLGAISYSLYLLHLPIGWRLMRAPELMLGAHLSPWSVGALYLVVLAVVIVVSWVAWRFWERPFQRLSGRLSTRAPHDPERRPAHDGLGSRQVQGVARIMLTP